MSDQEALASSKVTFHDLLTNPSGAGSAHVASRQLIRDALEGDFKKSIADPLLKPRYRASVTRGKKSAQYLIWVKVPSNSCLIEYDVLLLVTYEDGKSATAGALVQVYCNAPSWVFVSAYAFKTAGLLVPGWEKPLGKAAKDPPSRTNPMQDIGFDRVLFKALSWVLGPAGLRSKQDVERAALAPNVTGRTPRPDDRKLWAEAKLAEREEAVRTETAKRVIERKKEQQTKRAQTPSKPSKPSGQAKQAKKVASAKHVTPKARQTARKRKSNAT